MMSRDARVDVARQRHVDDQQRPARAARHHHLDGRPFDQHLRRCGRGQQHVGVDQCVGDLVERDHLGTQPRGRVLGMGARAIGDPDVLDTARTQRRRESGTHLPGADHEHLRTVEHAEVLSRDGDRGRRDRHRVSGDAGLGSDPLPRLNRVPEQTRELWRRALAHRGLPRLAHLAEDLALAHDHRVEAGGDREEVRDRGFVVIRVEQVGEVLGRGARVARQERAHVADRGVEVRAPRVDLGAVARREHDHLEQVLARRQVVEHLRELLVRNASSVRAGRRVPSGGSTRPRSETRVQELLRVRHAPARTSSTMPESKARCQSTLSVERPEARRPSRASASSSSSTSYSGPSSSVRRRRR